MSSKSRLSELERSLKSSGRTDLDELDNSALIRGETSDLLHDLTDNSVPMGKCSEITGGVLHTLA